MQDTDVVSSQGWEHFSEHTMLYTQLCELARIEPLQHALRLTDYSAIEDLAQQPIADRFTAGLHVFLDLMQQDERATTYVDRVLLDDYIAKIDQRIGLQLDSLLHHEKFQQLEASWRGLKFLIDRTDFTANNKVEIIDVSKEQLADDFSEVSEISHSGLYQHIYTQEYDTPGGEPVAAIIADYYFSALDPDVKLLTQIADIAALTHCPFIAAAGAEFFNKTDFAAVNQIDDISSYFDRAEYLPWNQFRQSEAARYVGLTLPRFLLRMPYGKQNPVSGFVYQETMFNRYHDNAAGNYLWGNASFAFAANLMQSFKEYGWTVNIRGPESGGKVVNLPLPRYALENMAEYKIPTEILIAESRELAFAELGFIPLSYYKNSDYACFFSANSTHKSALYHDPDLNANSRINARLPYVFLVSRIAHYLKVLQRENIGAHKTRLELETELNQWLKTLVTRMNNPDPAVAATHPLREAQVEVVELADNPGFYAVNLYVMPHFQIEGLDVHLSLVAKLPNHENKS